MNRHPHDHGHGEGHDHAHDHGHHHDHDDPLHPDLDAELNVEELDPAGKSLADALRVSFGVLKLIMIVLIVAYLFSGTSSVNEGTLAVRTVFGAVQGDPSRQVLEPGGPYLWWPEPIGQFITVPTTAQQVALDRAFWFHMNPGDELKTLDQLPVNDSLTPGRDGALLTGDRNVVHARWKINYRITDPVDFIRNVSSNSSTKVMLSEAEKLVRFASERGIVHIVAQTPADEFVRSNVNRAAIQNRIQKELDNLGAGIRITQVLLEQPTPPLAVRGAFQAVSQAESMKAQKIDAARQEATKILNDMTGGAHDALGLAIDAYELARTTGDAEAARLAEQVINDLLAREVPAQAIAPLEGKVDPQRYAEALNDPAVGGQVAQTIAEAQTERTELVSAAKRQADTFVQLLPQYQQNPRIFAQRRWQDVRQTILSGDVETIYTPSTPGKTMYLEINRDPRVQRERERRRYMNQQQQMQN